MGSVLGNPGNGTTAAGPLPLLTFIHSHRRGIPRLRSGRCVGRLDLQTLTTASAKRPGRRAYKLALAGTLLGYVGISGRQMKDFGWIHEMACADNLTK